MPIRHALRTLRRSPGFTVAVILTLALGLASVGTLFAIVHGVLLAPLPYGDPDRLVSLRLQSPDAGDIRQPAALRITYETHARRLDGVGFHRTGSTNVWTEGSDDVAQSVIATWVSASTLPLLQVTPLLGRTFTDEEDLRGGPDAVILSEAEWRSRFDASPEVIGKTLMVNSVRRQIVGVMPARFAFPLHAAQTRVWLPAKRADNGSVGDFSYSAVARLAPGATVEQAQHELASVLPLVADEFPRLDSGSATATWLADVRPTPVVVPSHDEVTAGIAQTLWILAAAAALVLFVAWANVTNLLLIRADGRQPELAVRAALGASRLRTATHFLAEASVLGAVSCVIALALVYGAVAALVAFAPTDVPRLSDLHVGLPTLAFVALVSIAGVLVCTAVPAGRFWRASLSDNLRDGARGASTGTSRRTLRAAITTLQIALALVVTLGSALLLRTAYGLSRVDPGFDPAQVTTLRMQLPLARYDDADAVRFFTQLTERVRQLSFVRDAGLTHKVPLGSGATPEESFRTAGDGQVRTLPAGVVDDGYFAAMSIPVLAGRGFGSLAHERGTDIVLSRLAAQTLFGDATADAIGKRVSLAPAGPEYTVIGVVGDVHQEDLAVAPSPLAYRALTVPNDPATEPGTRFNMALVVQSRGTTDAVVPAVRDIVRELDQTVSIYNVDTMQDVLRASTARLSLVLVLMTMAAAITLLLASIGLYGVMAYMVALRTREFGVRVALGADPARIAALVTTRGLALAAGGIGAGFVLYAIAAPLLRSFLFDVTVSDPVTLVAATVILLGVAILASWLPARRAARLDPSHALRAD